MVVPGFPLSDGAFAGGVAGVSLYLCQALLATGSVDVQVVRPFAPAGTPPYLDVGGIPVHPLVRPAWQPRYFHLLMGVRRQVAAKVRALRPSIVHEQANSYWAGQGPPHLVTLHGILEIDSWHRAGRLTRWLRYHLLHLMEGRARRRWPNVIAISPYSRQFLGLKGSQRVWEIPNPVADSYFEVCRTPVPGRVLAVGYIQRLKNITGLLRAFASLARDNPQARLRLAGSEPEPAYAAECRRFAVELGLADRVEFLGPLTVAQVQHELAYASVFASCSLQENAPLSIAEAMSAGVPVLATSVGGVPWMVDDGLTGRLAAPGDPAASGQQLARMLSVDDLGRMGATAKLKADCNFRGSEVAKRTLAAYRSLIGGSTGERLVAAPSNDWT